PRAGALRRPAAPPGADLPLPRAEAADARERHRDAGRRRREFEPGPVAADARQPAQAGPRPADEAAAGRPVRGERADADGAAPGGGEHLQGADRLAPRADQVPRAAAAAGVLSSSGGPLDVRALPPTPPAIRSTGGSAGRAER